MSKLLELQQEFTVCQAEFVNYATMRGYGLTCGDAFRDKRSHGEFGHKKGYAAAYSVHKLRLAKDYNLVIDGKLIWDGDHPAWVDLGEQWEKIHPLARSGRHWGDANHFSFEWKGYK